MLKIPIRRCDCLLGGHASGLRSDLGCGNNRGAPACKCDIRFVKALSLPQKTVSLKYVDNDLLTGLESVTTQTNDCMASWQTMFNIYTKHAISDNVSTAARIVYWHIYMPVVAPTDAFTVQLYHDVPGVDGTSAATMCNIRRWRNQLAVQKQDIMLLCADCSVTSDDTANILLFAAVCLATGGAAIIKLPHNMTEATASMAQLLCSGSDARIIAVMSSLPSVSVHVYLYIRKYIRHRNRKQLAEKLLKCDDPTQYIGPSDLFLMAYTQANRVYTTEHIN